MKEWVELTDEEKLLAKSLSMSADLPLKVRETHRLCTTCWFETPDVPVVT